MNVAKARVLGCISFTSQSTVGHCSEVEIQGFPDVKVTG
jgi:hypothetical protein